MQREFANQNADSTYNLRIPLRVCGFHLQLRIPQQLNSTIHMLHYSFVDSTNCSGFCDYGCGFRKFAYFWSNFERYSVLGICLRNPKQQRRSKKCSNVADSVTNLIWACCETHYNAQNAQFGLVMAKKCTIKSSRSKHKDQDKVETSGLGRDGRNIPILVYWSSSRSKHT